MLYHTSNNERYRGYIEFSPINVKCFDVICIGSFCLIAHFKIIPYHITTSTISSLSWIGIATSDVINSSYFFILYTYMYNALSCRF